MYMMLIGPLVIFGFLFGAGYLTDNFGWEQIGAIGAMMTVFAWLNMVYQRR